MKFCSRAEVIFGYMFRPWPAIFRSTKNYNYGTVKNCTQWDPISFKRWPATAETCSQISPNCIYCILFDVCCVLTVRNILYRFGYTQRDGLSKKKLIKNLFKRSHCSRCPLFISVHKQSIWYWQAQSTSHPSLQSLVLLPSCTCYGTFLSVVLVLCS